MGKKKAKSAKGPKKVVGVKLPKSLRTGDALAGLITSPVIRELAADVLIAVAGALAANRRPQDAAANVAANVSEAGSAVADAGRGATSLAQTASGAVAEVVAEAARRILPSTGKGEEGEAKRSYEHVGGDGGRKKRKDSAEQRREH